MLYTTDLFVCFLALSFSNLLMSSTYGDDAGLSITRAIKNGIYSPTSGIGAGIAGSIVHLAVRIVSGSLYLVSIVAQSCLSLGKRGFNKLCLRPDPLDERTLQCWYDLLEQIIRDLCDQGSSGALILRTVRLEEAALVKKDDDWSAYCLMLERLFGHIIRRIEQVVPYYQGSHEQRSWLIALASSMSDIDYDTITFLLNEVKHDLAYVAQKCLTSSSRDELHLDQIRPILHSILLMLRKIQTLIAPGVVQSSASTGSSLLTLGNQQPRFDGLFL